MSETLPPAPTDLVRKRSAEVTRRAPVRPPARHAPGRHVETLVGTRAAIGREVTRLSRAGELVDTGHLRVIPSGPDAGKLELRVIRKPARKIPMYAKVCIGIGSVVGAFSGVFLAFVWLLSSLSAASLAALCGCVLLLLAALARKGKAARTPGVTVTVSTTVTVR